MDPDCQALLRHPHPSPCPPGAADRPLQTRSCGCQALFILQARPAEPGRFPELPAGTQSQGSISICHPPLPASGPLPNHKPSFGTKNVIWTKQFISNDFMRSYINNSPPATAGKLCGHSETSDKSLLFSRLRALAFFGKTTSNPTCP